MAYTIKINTGSGLVTFTTAEFDKGTLEKTKDKQNEVVTFDGVIRFTGAEYLTLQGLLSSVILPCELWRDTHLEIDGNIDLRGKYNDSEEYCELKIVNDTPNEKFLRAYTEELQPLNYSPSITATLYEGKRHITFAYRRVYDILTTPVFLDPLPPAADKWEYWSYGIITPCGGVNIYAREQYTVSEEAAQIYINASANWTIVTDNGDGSVIIARKFTDGGFSSPGLTVSCDSNAVAPSYLPSANSEFTDPSDLNVNWYFDLLSFPSHGSCAAFDVYTWLDLDTYYGATSEPYKNFRSVTELIRDWAYNEVNDLYFDEESFEFEDFKHDDPNDYPYANLLLASIQDVIPASGVLTQKSGLNTNLRTTMKDVLDWFAQQMSIYWYIENVSDVYYFRMKHISQITSSASGTDLTNLHGENWCEDGEIYEYDSNTYRELRRNMLAGSVDFTDNSIIFNNFKDIISEKMELDGNKILTDLSDIWEFPDKYPITSDTQMFMCACLGRGIAVGTNVITGWTNIDLGTFATSSLDVSGTGAGSCETNTFSVSAGVVYLFQMDSCSADSDIQITITTNTYNPFKVIRDSMNRIMIIARDSSAVAKIKLTNTSGSFALTNTTAGVQTADQKKAVGEISGIAMPNGDLALSKLNRYSNIYDLQDTDINVNGSNITGNAGKTRKVEVTAPFDYLDDINLHETMVHELGAVEVDKVSIPMDGSMAKLSCKY